MPPSTGNEPGAEDLAAQLIAMGIGVEAGIRSGTDAAARFAASPLGPRVLRVLAEVTDPNPESAKATAYALLSDLGDAHGRPVLLHGEGAAHGRCCDWPDGWGTGHAHRAGGHAVPSDGQRAVSNAQLVAEGLIQYGCARRSSPDR